MGVPGETRVREGAQTEPRPLQAEKGTARTWDEGFASARRAPSEAGGQSVRPGREALGMWDRAPSSGRAGGAERAAGRAPVPTAARSQAAGRQPGWTPAAACPPPRGRQEVLPRAKSHGCCLHVMPKPHLLTLRFRTVRGLGASLRCFRLVPTHGQRGLFVLFGENLRPGTSGCRLQEATCVSSGHQLTPLNPVQWT